MKQEYPILEYDDHSPAIIDPHANEVEGGLPEACVLCFFYDVLANLAEKGDLVKVGQLQTENSPLPIFLYTSDEGRKVAVMNPQVGAPLAAGVMEKMIVHGCKKIIAVGGAGSLVHDHDVTHLVIPTAAIRDEGVSYHYLPPSREVQPDAEGVAVIEAVLKNHNLPYVKSKTWTTSAYFRETHDKRELRISEGCTVVEMEAAAFFAVAKFRGVQMAQLLYAGDLVVPDGWDHRDWQTRDDIRSHMFDLAIETVIEWTK
jgi:purine-nucleoside phosphorylase